MQWWQAPAGQGPTASETPHHLRVFSGAGREAADTKSELLLSLTASHGRAAGVPANETPPASRTVRSHSAGGCWRCVGSKCVPKPCSLDPFAKG